MWQIPGTNMHSPVIVIRKSSPPLFAYPKIHGLIGRENKFTPVFFTTTADGQKIKHAPRV
jgi:hypothetical protein